MIEKRYILSAVRTKQQVLIGQSLIEQLATTLYIFADVEEVMETAKEIREYDTHHEVIGL